MGFRDTVTSLDDVTLTNADVTGTLQTAPSGPRVRIRQTSSDGSIDTGVVEFLGEDAAPSPILSGSSGLWGATATLDNGAGGRFGVNYVDAPAGGKRNEARVDADVLTLPAATIIPAAAVALTVNGGWLAAAGHAPRGFLTAEGDVRLVGWFTNGGAYVANATQTPITLPTQWRPLQTQVIEITIGAGNLHGLVTVLTTGVLRIDSTQGATVPASTNHYLDGVVIYLD